MASPASVLYVELVMSVDRITESARAAAARREAEGVVGTPEDWPPHVVVAHVADVDEQVWGPRLVQMVAAYEAGDPPPHFDWWEPDGQATYARYCDSTVEDAAARLMSTRIMLMTSLRELTPEQWAGARAQHDVFGEMDVEALVLATLGHDEEHRGSLVLR
jgi:hypothetical protein